MNLYSIAMKIEATVYIKAESAEEATRKADFLDGTALEVSDAGGYTPVSNLSYSDPEMPNISFSPAMTVVCRYPDSTPDLVHTYETNDAVRTGLVGDQS